MVSLSPVPPPRDFGDDDDDSARSYFGEIDESVTPDAAGDSRDEVAEVKELTGKQTRSVHIWRMLVVAVLLLTGAAVSTGTYIFLSQAKEDDYKISFKLFATSMEDTFRYHTKDVKVGIEDISDIIVSVGETNGESFPFVTLDNFEVYAEQAIERSRLEGIAFCPVVMQDEVAQWNNYSVANQGWLGKSYKTYEERLESSDEDSYVPAQADIVPILYTTLPDETVVPVEMMGPGPYLPIWHYSPPPITPYIINYDLASFPDFDLLYDVAIESRQDFVLSNHYDQSVYSDNTLTKEQHLAIHEHYVDVEDVNGTGIWGWGHPHSVLLAPVFAKRVSATDSTSEQEDSRELVGIIQATVLWDSHFVGLLPEGINGVFAVLKNSCGQAFTYRIDGNKATFLGPEDLHETAYDDLVQVIEIFEVPKFSEKQIQDGALSSICGWDLYVYPSKTFEKEFDSNLPVIFAIIVAAIFFFVVIVFFMYNFTVETRNEMVVSKAAQSNAIVTSMIPEHLRARLMDENEQAQNQKKNGNLKAFLNTGDHGGLGGLKGVASKPLADLFLETTVLFADISGFTAWSSVREPTQVFILLETLYHSFDVLAKRRAVFKVETVGDCYVAVTGLPEPRADHAIVMARFARDILSKMNVLTKELEVTLGPDTGDLALRVGMHSGPVTAGVLRGERARFQLFGDTMNTCSRLESSSQRGRVLCSKETAELIKKAGKEAWVEKRVDNVFAKGKGQMETYWVNALGGRAGSVRSCISEDLQGFSKSKGAVYGRPYPGLTEKTHRLVDWNVEMLLRLMKEVVASRNSVAKKSSLTKKPSSTKSLKLGATPLEEVREIIALPEFEFDGKTIQKQDPENVQIPKDVVEQLHLLVSKIADMYNPNPFHNFDHASHVVMSCIKLMSRIVAPVELDGTAGKTAAVALHDHTYGITSDPLTRFACAFSALIHDVDHVGVSNAQLVKEESPLAARFNDRSVAEQNSLELSWSLMMREEFGAFRAFLFPTQTELVRFRQLVVNSVMSTDIVDKDMKNLRNERWDKAFKKGDNANHVDENPRDEVNRKATIVIEHIIQASDISHTMQHWHVYRKWNQNLFEELYVAYLNGRMEKDPSDFWWRGEFGFFDFYIIPLTKKLQECGVFGVSSGEYLGYAQKNRQEWEERGEEVVAGMIKEAREKYGVKGALKASAIEHISLKPEQAPPLIESQPQKPDVWC